MKPTFSRLASFWSRLRTIFRGHALVFSRSTVYFLSHSLILNPISDDFSMARHSFQPRNSLFPCFSLYFPTLRALLRKIPTHYFLRAPLFALREGFSDSCFPHSSRPAPPSYFPLISFPLFIHPSLFAPSPTFFLIPPHFSISLPNKRTIARTLAQYARTRTPAHTYTSGGFRLLPSPLHPPLAIHWAPMH